MTPPRPRLILADDHHMFVDSLSASLRRRRYDVVAVVYSGDELLDILRPGMADCLLLDLSMPGRNGLELLPDILATDPDLSVLVVTMHLDRVIADAVLDAGAHGFIPKDSTHTELDEAIRRVLAGEIYVSPRVPHITFGMGMGAPHAGLGQLTSRQIAILIMISEGCSSAEIARRLNLSERTIAFHRTNIRAKLGVGDSDHLLMRYAILAREGAQSKTAGDPESEDGS